MGCVSEGGCLGPKRRQRDVYAELIDNIHEEARKMQFSDNLNIYNAIRQKIHKKGYIGKLLDNLTSHRANISDSLSYNLRLTTQSNHIESKYAGLIILNEIVNNLYEKKQSDIVSNEERTVIKTNSSNKMLVNNASSQNDRQMASFAIDIRTEVQYFRLVTHLLQNQGRMYPKTLQSIIKFSTTKKQPFGCKSEVLRVLELIMKKIEGGKSVNESVGAYLALIQQLRQSNQDEIDYENVLLSFIKLWLSRQNQVQVYEGVQMSLQVKYQQILRVLIRRCISSSKLSSIYRAIFAIYDQERFSGSRVFQMEDLVFKIIKENDLQSPVIRGAFIYMLQYLSVTISNRDKSFSYRSSGAEEFQGSRYARIMDKGGRLRAFQTLRRWACKDYYNLEQYINFSSSALVAAFTINLGLERQYARQIMKQFLRLTEPINSKYTLILVNLLMQQIKLQTNNDILRLTLIALVREVISERGLIEKNKKEDFTYFIIMDGTFSKQSRLELIQLMGFITKRIPSECFVITDINNTHFSQNLCEFMHSIYEGMLFSAIDARPSKKAEQEDILFRYQFANSTISFMKCLAQKGAYPFILCFISSVAGCITQSILQNKVSLYFLFYVLYSAMHLLNSKQKIPDKMVAVNFKISPSLKSQEIKPQIEAVVDNLVGTRGQNLERLISSVQTTCEQLRQFIMITATQYNQTSTYFGDYFRGKLRKDSIYVQNSKEKFRRESFNDSNLQSSLNKSKMDDDLSFKDVIERINQI